MDTSRARKPTGHFDPSTARLVEEPTQAQTEFERLQERANNGDVESQVHLAGKYLNGEGVEENRSEAAKWFRKAAEQGDAIAQINLGIAYLDGKGVSQNFREARKWFKEAAQQGSQSARNFERLAIVSQIVSDYHRTHTYVKRDVFVCSDMAADVWNMVLTAGINAKIAVGNIEKGTSSLLDINHAWVLAETEPGRWLALETTGGFTVENDSRYYQGHFLKNARELREFNTLMRDYRMAQQRKEVALASYERSRQQYNQALMFGENQLVLRALADEAGQRTAVARQANNDMFTAIAEVRRLLAHQR